MAHLLSMSKLHREAIREVQDEIVQIIRDYVEDLKAAGKYDDLVQQVKQFKLATQIFDAFGETVDNYSVHDMFTTTDTDIERQFQIADVKLGREGIGMAYGNKYGDLSDLTAFKIDVILFVADENCMNRLHSYAENRFHGLNDDYRRYIATINSEKIRRDYDSIVSDGDVVSKHNFRLPETIQVPHEAGGKEYRDHLFVSDTTGTAKLKLNGWEADLIAEEEKRQDFVCWIRNPSRASWALCIPYEINGEIKPTYPDFIIVRIAAAGRGLLYTSASFSGQSDFASQKSRICAVTHVTKSACPTAAEKHLPPHSALLQSTPPTPFPRQPEAKV